MRLITPIKKGLFLVQEFLQLKWIQAVIISGVLLVTLICLVQPEHYLLKLISVQTVLILLGWLVVGVIFLLLRSTSLAFVCLFCCAALSLFLKNASNVSLAGPSPLLNQDMIFTVGHFNMSSIQENLEEDLELIKSLDRDILIFQEYTPQFRRQILAYFDTVYDQHIEFMRMDDFGQIIFSNFPMLEKDTILVYGMPMLRLKVQIKDGSPLHILSQYNLPPLTDTLKKEARLIFDQLADYIHDVGEPLILAGTLNYVSWENQLVKFRYDADLHDSRRSYFPSLTNNGNKSIFSAPVDHIFYNNYLECIQFKKIENQKNVRIGIRGIYQINPNERFLSTAMEAD